MFPLATFFYFKKGGQREIDRQKIGRSAHRKITLRDFPSRVFGQAERGGEFFGQRARAGDPKNIARELLRQRAGLHSRAEELDFQPVPGSRDPCFCGRTAPGSNIVVVAAEAANADVDAFGVGAGVAELDLGEDWRDCPIL